ncbi:hypothetical protein HA152_07595 [Prochlorococcus marinus XMU1412]|uniref:hypothetical protein n=1 Tax=Prochlorococcus marinus TaxID=1219 RepID=UPI001ADCB4A0|nr:hypothetical protein [Prochlorococcus marinus]MBO8240565.1 hypothetical protein [Prochlorococcus marinus XMU1412]MBW3071800.1 hypothetical protein [Prochlorococcus marinus str. MU1412]
MFYSSFGLIFKSEDITLQELEAITNKNNNFDVLIKQNNHNEWPVINSNQFDTEFLQMEENDFRLKVDGIAHFRVIDGNQIFWDKLSAKVTENDIKAFLFSSVFGALLIQRGFLLLHGNSLTKNKKLIICLGKSGIGKSTISYMLMKKGWQLITDDLVAIDKNMNVSIGIQRIKLWKDTLNYLKIDYKNLKKVRSNIQKFILSKDELNISKKSYPITSVFILYSETQLDKKSKTTDAIKVKKEKTKFFVLRDNIFRPRFVKGLCKESEYFTKLSNFAKKLPVFLLPIPNDLKRMENFLKNDFDDFFF